MIVSCNWVIGAIKSQSSEEAYVTLLYGDEFLLGVRVLGKSIRDSGSIKDMVVLVSDGVSQYANDLLRREITMKVIVFRYGFIFLLMFVSCIWVIGTIKAESSEEAYVTLLYGDEFLLGVRVLGKSIRDSGSTKDMIVLVSDGADVVYLDTDTIVVKSTEDLFKCGKFCANLKHSERLNSDVMVIEPSDEVFKDMMSSCCLGDQGFLNFYYVGFANARVYEPNQPLDVLNSRKVPEMERLSTLYNADVGLYMLANKWMVDEKELRVIHYTLGPLKPWDWWTSWLLKPVDVWQNVRVRLQESLPGTGGGKNPRDELVVKFLFLLPLLLIVFCYYQSCLQTRSLFDHIRQLYYKIRAGGVLAYSSVPSSTVLSDQQPKVPAFLGGISICICFAAALFGSYLHLIYQYGKAVANQAGQFRADPASLDHESGKGHQRQQSCCDIAACYYGLGMAFLAILAPALPSIFGITALFLSTRQSGTGKS
ncbi:hypothetical protein RND71_025855 [Anisodus tanguticus]|uniref:Uncharacterized protein n=1 Tax=Anisodus tanguticus TaxID=243964 RepID=A0AAE1RMD5_9SOLA|nr:hypothetical protein RND71_025855 [Anisodus tanguticus]